MSLNIVYFSYINKLVNYSIIIEGQLDDIIISGIGLVSKLYVVCCCEDESLINIVQKMFHNKLYNIIKYELEIQRVNNYEYHGINKLYSLSLLEPNSYFLYLHSKGMVFSTLQRQTLSAKISLKKAVPPTQWYCTKLSGDRNPPLSHCLKGRVCLKNNVKIGKCENFNISTFPNY